MRLMRQLTQFTQLILIVLVFKIPYCVSHGVHHDNEEHGKDNYDTIVNALLATTLITLGGNAALFVFSLFDIGQKGLHVLLAFAMGSLLGDAFLHLIPHAQSESIGDHHHHHHDEHDHDEHDHNEHDHDHGGVGLDVLYGILAFLLVEKMLHNMDVGTDRGIKTGAVLNLIGDAIHNFTDGMAIASAFLISEPIGRSVTLAVLLHEIPHELGDFAVLVSHGFSKRGAFMSQFVSAIGAYLGMFLSLVLPNTPKTKTKQNHKGTATALYLGTTNSDFPTERVLGFTAGGFIYISLVEISPKLFQHGNTWLQSSIELGAVMSGIAFMNSMIELEDAMGV